MDAALDGLDLVLTPTLPIVAPPLHRGGAGDLDVREQLIRFTYPFSALGWPALALPVRRRRGRPAGVAPDRGHARAPTRSCSPPRACWSRPRLKLPRRRGR